MNNFDSSNFELTKQELPIEATWVIASQISSLIIFFYLLLMLLIGIAVNNIMLMLVATVLIVLMLVSIIFRLLYRELERQNFHFSITPQGIRTDQGILAKTQRNINYNVIQNVLIRQDLSEVLLGLADVHIENATSNGIQVAGGMVVSNGVVVAGLSEANARYLRIVILENMKLHLKQGLQQGL